MVLIAAATIGLLFQFIGTYLVWPSRWNIPAHIQVGFAFTAYIVPALFTDALQKDSQELIQDYLSIQIVGSVAYVAGILASKFFNQPLVQLHRGIGARVMDLSEDAIIRRVGVLAVAACVGLLLSFSIMGFIPMFAENPLAAKQFKGEYQAPYHRAAWIFRLSFAVAVTVIPVLLAAAWRRSQKVYWGLSGLLTLLLVATLARQAAAMGVVTFLGLLAAHYRRFVAAYIIGVIVLFGIGSSAYYILAVILDIDFIKRAYEGLSIAQVIAAGAPDISDQLLLLDNFLHRPEYTYGRTFWGGLIPFNYPWNPSVWTILTANPGLDDISDTVSGGLRLPVSLWGYVAFGWGGCVGVPLLSGLFIGLASRYMRHYIPKVGLLKAGLLLLIYTTLLLEVSNFYILSIHAIPGILVALYLCIGLPRIRLGITRSRSTLSP